LQPDVPQATAVGTYDFFGTQRSSDLSEENSLVLSESLDEDAVQTLVEVALSTIFPKQCDEWRATKKDVRRSFHEDMEKGQQKICQELNGQESSLRHALRDAVVDDVTKLFPYVFIRSSSSTVC
jgi:hypothetical protein